MKITLEPTLPVGSRPQRKLTPTTRGLLRLYIVISMIWMSVTGLSYWPQISASVDNNCWTGPEAWSAPSATQRLIDQILSAPVGGMGRQSGPPRSTVGQIVPEEEIYCPGLYPRELIR